MKTTLLLLLLSTSFAHASISEQSLRQPTPPASVASQAEMPSSSGLFQTQLFSFGLGSGVNAFGGNIGKLYSSSSPVVDLRFGWTFAPSWSLRAGADLSRHAFSAQPNGSVEVSMQSYHLVSQTHLLETALASEGFDPFVYLGLNGVARRQTYRAMNTVETDRALGVAAGLGANYLFSGSRLALWTEGGAGKVFFRDRFEGEYAESGVEDTTGLLYSARLGVKYYF